jgi:large subunit ribosomal protein L24
MKTTQKVKNPKLHIKKGDNVKVIAGNEKGKVGKVLRILTQKQRAFVEGVNLVTHYIKPTPKSPKGGMKRKEASLHISNLILIEPATQAPTRIGRKTDEKGKLQRFSKKTGKLI